jgi:acyl-CoA synthetase (AMP-forming)/AMP-acid ligase II
VTAFIVPSGGGRLDEKQLIAFALERLAAYKCPKRVVTVDKLPRNAMGKVQRSALRAS